MRPCALSSWRDALPKRWLELSVTPWVPSRCFAITSAVSPTRSFCLSPSRPHLAAQEVSRPRSDHPPTQTELFGVRDQPGAERTKPAPQSDRRWRSVEGGSFAPLPRRRDEERPQYPRASVEPVANVAEFSLAPRQFTTHCGGLFLFLPDLLSLGLEQLAQAAHLPGSKMIPAPHALRACLALKLWSIERKSHVMALVADEAWPYFPGSMPFPRRAISRNIPLALPRLKSLSC